MYKKVLFSSLLGLLFLLPACNKCEGLNTKCAPTPPPDPTIENSVETTSVLQQPALQKTAFTYDLPAQELYKNFYQQEKKVFPLYRLKNDDLITANKVLKNSGNPKKFKDGWQVEENGRVFRYNENSHSVFYKDRQKFHKGIGAKEIPGDDFYLEKAQNILADLGLSEKLTAAELTPYKIRHYKNVSLDEASGDNEETTYQVAIAFNSVLDGIPTIGSGGKIAIHMDLEGNLVSFESTIRDAEEIGTISIEELISPEEALEKIKERFKEREISLDGLYLERAEFGYLRLGRNSIQNYLMPHYFFVFMPEEGVMDKKRVEWVSAMPEGKWQEMLDEDAALEAARKNAKKEIAAKEISKLD